MIHYIAGPYTKGDVAQNVRNALRLADYLANKGETPYLPHLTHFWHLVFPREYEFWLKYDRVFLEKCDTLIRLPGESSGADEEMALAGKRQMPIHLFGGFDLESLDLFDKWLCSLFVNRN